MEELFQLDPEAEVPADPPDTGDDEPTPLERLGQALTDAAGDAAEEVVERLLDKRRRQRTGDTPP